ncbi:unnamed protein product [Prorocentrum cordatum]|uniref:Uncharacterized protein n=1 Tax=Prorocentrum cordatum TaxID=2364126 RepID=A0ABN9V1Q6_9DINO|nr:unnamed protein product [Polarella glacialis]
MAARSPTRTASPTKHSPTAKATALSAPPLPRAPVSAHSVRATNATSESWTLEQVWRISCSVARPPSLWTRSAKPTLRQTRRDARYSAGPPTAPQKNVARSGTVPRAAASCSARPQKLVRQATKPPLKAAATRTALGVAGDGRRTRPRPRRPPRRTAVRSTAQRALAGAFPPGLRGEPSGPPPPEALASQDAPWPPAPLALSLAGSSASSSAAEAPASTAPVAFSSRPAASTPARAAGPGGSSAAARGVQEWFSASAAKPQSSTCSMASGSLRSLAA